MTHISQILITDEPVTELPPRLADAVGSVVRHIAHSSHTLYTKQPLRLWIEREYGGEMQKAFDKLIPYAYKADLARYLLLYRLGGWYFDISTRVVSAVNAVQGIDMIAFLDTFHNQNVPLRYCNSVLYAVAGCPIVAHVIDNICANIAAEAYGRNNLSVSGPEVLGRQLTRYGEDFAVVTGAFVDLTPHYPRKNRGYVFNDGTLLALHKGENMGGDLSSLGAVGTNNYVHLYQQRNVYDGSISVSPALNHQSGIAPPPPANLIFNRCSLKPAFQAVFIFGRRDISQDD